MFQFFPKTIILSLVFLSLSGILPFFEISQPVQAQYLQLSAEQVKAALRCPTDASKEFVDDVFMLVSLGKLPESLVISAFQYAYKQPKNQWYYFQKSLELRCERMKIDLADEISKLKE